MGARPDTTWRNLWRKDVPIECEYTCRNGDVEAKVKATHVAKYWTDENALACQGVTYKRQWVNAGPGYAREVELPQVNPFAVGDDFAPSLRALLKK
jgi:hypothetical protein